MMSTSTTMVTLAFEAKKDRINPCRSMPSVVLFLLLRRRLPREGRSDGVGLST